MPQTPAERLAHNVAILADFWQRHGQPRPVALAWAIEQAVAMREAELAETEAVA